MTSARALSPVMQTRGPASGRGRDGRIFTRRGPLFPAPVNGGRAGVTFAAVLCSACPRLEG